MGKGIETRRAAELYLKQAKASKADNTYKNYRRCLNHFLESGVPQTLAAVKHGHCWDWAFTDGLKPSTQSNRLASLRVFFEYAVKRGWVAESPCRAIEFPRVKAKEVTPYTVEQMEMIERAADSPAELAVILTLRYTALRISDVISLPISALVGDEVRTNAQKNGRHVRLPLPERAADALRTQAAASGSEFFFVAAGETPASALTRWKRLLVGLYKRCGVPGAGNHRYRHTMATRMLEAGATIDEVADALGISPDIVRKRYAKWTEERASRVAGLMRAAW